MVSLFLGAQTAILLLLGLTLAGCIGNDDLGPDADSASATTDPDALGVVTGRVVTESLDPLSAARVSLIQDGLLAAGTTTDPEGYYRIESVEPGEYWVQVTSACCRESLQAISLQAGQEREVHVQLEYLTAIDIGEPHVEVHHWRGFVGCSFVTATPVTGGYVWTCPDDNQDRVRTFKVQQGLESVVVAFDWDPEMTNLEGTLRIWLERGSSRLAQLNGEPPIHFRVDAGEDPDATNDFVNIEDEWELRFRVWAGGWVNVVYQQPFTVDYHLFYNEPAPDGYQAAPE